MGAFFNKLFDDDRKGPDIFLDFEKATPESEEERQVYESVAAVLDKGPEVIEQLGEYIGCEEYIRKAITSPGAETEKAAWEAILPAVDQLQNFYEFSLELEQCFPKLLVALCKGTDPTQTISTQQALAKQLADVFDFVLRFDDSKMVNPAIQNDFSYYRRTLNRMKLSKKDQNIKIRDELANRMSLFFAYPTPMMRCLSETTVKFLKQNSIPRDNVTNGLALMANICQDMVDKNKFSSAQTNMFCLRAMTGCIILVDHIHTLGAFHRKSPINIKGCITVLKNFLDNPTYGLLNALRFTTIHLNDPDTPTSIKQLLA
eukprot:TRINITY_DN1977_c0_g2_i1.p1 TRINITY_DN1977_c0_g2~~TRINITY_DN1977_c0_g2_i1.p1  ORF type:complete len:316 (-),score=50.99 TRINITY_DN1977_c0_g2_i1:155-1102(-)